MPVVTWGFQIIAGKFPLKNYLCAFFLHNSKPMVFFLEEISSFLLLELNAVQWDISEMLQPCTACDSFKSHFYFDK